MQTSWLASPFMYLQQYLFRRPEVFAPGRVGIQLQVQQRQLNDILRGVEETDPAIGKLRDDRRIEDHVEAVDRRIRHPRTDLVDVVGKAVDRMHVGNRIAVARIVGGLDLQDPRVEVLPVRQQAAVERLVDPGADLAAEEVRRGEHDVIAAAARHQPGLHRFLGIVEVVDDLDAGALFEIGDGVAADEIGPVVDEQAPLLGRPGREHNRHEQCHQE